MAAEGEQRGGCEAQLGSWPDVGRMRLRRDEAGKPEPAPVICEHQERGLEVVSKD